jgi:hypothetical protein
LFSIVVFGSRARESGALLRRSRAEGLGEFSIRPQAVAVPADVDDVAVMKKPVDETAAMSSSPGLASFL